MWKKNLTPKSKNGRKQRGQSGATEMLRNGNGALNYSVSGGNGKLYLQVFGGRFC